MGKNFSVLELKVTVNGKTWNELGVCENGPGVSGVRVQRSLAVWNCAWSTVDSLQHV